VSDREMMTLYADGVERLKLAEQMVAEGRGKDFLPHKMSLFGAPTSADRFVALAAKGGLDDMFSSDLIDDELKAKLGVVGVPALVLVSREDESVPMWVDKELLLKRMCAAMPNARGKVSKCPR
jgi:pimeloyl-ACP methyl ester carboxylesterase